MNDNLCSDWSKDSGAKYGSWARLLVDLYVYPDQREDLFGSSIIRFIPEIKIQRAGHHFIKLIMESVRDGGTVMF